MPNFGQLDRWSLAFNPTLVRAVKGSGAKEEFGFSPNVEEQEHQFIPAIDLNISPKWEFNLGVGVTSSTYHLIGKMIVERRFEFTRKH